MERLGFYDDAGRWYPIPASLTMRELSDKLLEFKAQDDPAQRVPGETLEQFAMRRVLEWAIADDLIRRGLSLQMHRHAMPWNAVKRGHVALNAHVRPVKAVG